MACSTPSRRGMDCAFHPRCPCAFGACQREVPPLLTPSSAAPEQQVACHLYDAGVNPDGLSSQLRPAPAEQKEAQHWRSLRKRRTCEPGAAAAYHAR